MDEITPSTPADHEPINWTASEFIAHQKSFGWYATLTLVATVVAALVYIASKDYVSVAVVIVGAMVFGIYAARQPRQLEYGLDRSGVTIGSKSHAYDEFRSFSVVPEGAFSNITFMPLKRFAVPLSIYYAPEDEERIVKVLSDYLPYTEPSHDAIDRLMRRIRF